MLRFEDESLCDQEGAPGRRYLIATRIDAFSVDRAVMQQRCFPIGGRLPVQERTCRIVSVERTDEGWRYRLDNGSPITHQAALASIAANALFAHRQEVFMGRNGWRIVVHRKWSFRHGITFYRVADPRRNVASQWIPEDRMVAFTRDFPGPPAPDSPAADALSPGWDLRSVM